MPTKPAQLTDSTGQTPDDTVANVAAPVAASGEATAADLTTTAAAIAAIEDSLSDLAAKVNALTAAPTGATFGPNADRTANDPNTNGS